MEEGVIGFGLLTALMGLGLVRGLGSCGPHGDHNGR